MRHRLKRSAEPAGDRRRAGSIDVCGPEFRIENPRSGSNILPPKKQSVSARIFGNRSKSWMLGIHILTHPSGQHLHPKSLTPKAKSVFDTAFGWLRANKPDTLFSKSNPDGFRLLPTAMAICWILVEIDGEMKAKLFLGNAYDAGIDVARVEPKGSTLVYFQPIDFTP